MKQYGFNMATEFTKKQVNVIYALNKQGKLNVPDEAIKEFYNLADYYGYDYNRSITDREQIILLTLEAIFANDLEEAQRKIDLYKSLYLDDLSEEDDEDATEYRIYADTAEVSASDYKNGTYDSMAIVENSTSDPIIITTDKAEAYRMWEALNDPAVRHMPYTGTYRLEGFWMDEGSEYGIELLEISDFAKAEVL